MEHNYRKHKKNDVKKDPKMGVKSRPKMDTEKSKHIKKKSRQQYINK
jgi:hypothetical protein